MLFNPWKKSLKKSWYFNCKPKVMGNGNGTKDHNMKVESV